MPSVTSAMSLPCPGPHAAPLLVEPDPRHHRRSVSVRPPERAGGTSSLSFWVGRVKRRYGSKGKSEATRCHTEQIKSRTGGSPGPPCIVTHWPVSWRRAISLDRGVLLEHAAEENDLAVSRKSRSSWPEPDGRVDRRPQGLARDAASLKKTDWLAATERAEARRP